MTGRSGSALSLGFAWLRRAVGGTLERVRIWACGHGAREIGAFIDLLRGAAVTVVADIRTFPGSRRHPQFGSEALAAALAEAGVSYVHLRGLGGRRRAGASSPHRALRTPGFRGYADHTATPEFARDLERLEAVARERPTAYMCAETLWWKCHRRILSDVLVARGWEVQHLVHPGAEPEHHALWDIARVTADGSVVYDAGQPALLP